jgi:hypothetical protein
MSIETKRYDVTEVYIEDKSYRVVMDFIKEKRKEGFVAINPTTHYGKHGNEEDKMWHSTLSKKVEFMKG